MDLQFTEEQNMMRKLVRDFAEKDISPVVADMEAHGTFPRAILTKMAKLGLMGIYVPDEYGGAGMDFTSYIIAIHELSKVSATLGVILSVHSSVGTNPILMFGTNAQKEKYVPKLASGAYLGAFALTETSAGSDAASLKTRATKRGDHYILNGSKQFITNGGEADTYIVFAKTSEERISAFIVEKSMPGLVVGKDEKKMGLHGSRTVELSFQDMPVPVENLLGEEGQGFKVALSNLNVGRIGIAAQALGIAEAALDHAKRYAKTREQFNKPIGMHQGVGFKLADMAVQVEAATLLVYKAAYLHEKRKDCIAAAAMAKLFASQTAMHVTTEAVQIYGGYGYTKDYPVERFFRDAKITEIYEGTSEIQRIVISKQLFAKGES